MTGDKLNRARFFVIVSKGKSENATSRNAYNTIFVLYLVAVKVFHKRGTMSCY